MTFYDLDGLGQEPAPHFAVRYLGARTEMEGRRECLIGEKLPGPTADQPDGLFVEWRWDGRRLIVKNDHYGFSPLFYTRGDNAIRISPSLAQVLQGADSKELDYDALAVILRMGHPVGDDTPFRAVRALPPGSTLTWEQGRMRIDTPELPIRCGPYAAYPFDDAADRFAELFDRAIRKRLPAGGNLVFPLSGGRDSRHILFALEANGIKPDSCVTLKFRPPTTDEDARIASRIATAMRIDHQVLEKTPSLFHAVRKEVQLSNFCAGAHIWILPLAAYLKGRTGTLYDGLAGSVLSGGFMTDESKIRLYRANRLEELALIVLNQAKHEGFIQTVLRPAFREKVGIERAVERIVKELQRHADATNPMQSFIFWNRTRRGVSQIPLAIMASIPTVHCPYLDREVYEFLTSVEPTYFLGNRLHDETIRRAYPHHSDLPYEDVSRKARYRPGDHAYFKRTLQQFARYLFEDGIGAPWTIRKDYLFPRIGYDLIMRNHQMPWYLIGSVYCLELERLADSV